MFLNNIITDGQAQPRAITKVLGRKIRIKDAVEIFPFDSNACILHFNFSKIAFNIFLCAKMNNTTFRHGIGRITNQIKNHLLNLGTVAENMLQPL